VWKMESRGFSFAKLKALVHSAEVFRSFLAGEERGEGCYTMAVVSILGTLAGTARVGRRLRFGQNHSAF